MPRIVDLPQPLGPTTARNWPRGMTSEIPSTATYHPRSVAKARVTPRSSMAISGDDAISNHPRRAKAREFVVVNAREPQQYVVGVRAERRGGPLHLARRVGEFRHDPRH